MKIYLLAKKKLLMFKKFFSILLLVIIFDLLINLILPKQIKQLVGSQRSYSLYSKKFDHIIDSNVRTTNIWGKNKYNVFTDQNGFRVGDNYKYNPSLKNIGFVGDSFVWGSGLDYKYHFISSLKSKDYNYLNFGYLSYSPSIYYKKLEHLINEKKVSFEKVFLFVDHTDIQDEGIFYREDKKGNIVRANHSQFENKIRYFKHSVKNYLKVNSFFFKFYEGFYGKTNLTKLQQCFDKDDIDHYINFLNEDRNNYTFKKELQTVDWVIKGKKKAKIYLDKIHNLLLQNNIKLIVVIYPSASEILNQIEEKNSYHSNFLKEWIFEKKDVDLLNLHDFFKRSKKPLLDYKKYFISCDIHWNEEGHKTISQAINSIYFKK